MNVQRIAAVASKEWREIVRDRLFFALAFIVPMMLMLLFGYGLSLDVENLPFAVVDSDRTPASRDYAYRYIGSRYFDFQGYVADEREIGRLLTTNKIRMALVIPKDFGRDLAAERQVTVQTLFDGTFPERAQTAKGYVLAIGNAVNSENLGSFLAQAGGGSPRQAEARGEPVRLSVRYLYNQSVQSIWSLAPKLIMFVMMLSPPFLTALGVVREKESGAIYNIYASTVSRGEFLLGKLIPYVAISVTNAMILWCLATWLFGAPFKGDPLFFGLVTVLYVICTTGIGLIVSVLVQTQVAAMIVVSIVTTIPAVLYSGMLIPIPSLSEGAQLVAHLMPTMYYTDIVVGTFLKGISWAALWPDVAVLAAYAAALFGAGFALFSKRPKT